MGGRCTTKAESDSKATSIAVDPVFGVAKNANL